MQTLEATDPTKGIIAVFYRIGTGIDEALYFKTENKQEALECALSIIPMKHRIRPTREFKVPFTILNVYHRPDYIGWYWVP